jgi:hypothetical protein
MKAVQQFEHLGTSEGHNAHLRLSSALEFDIFGLHAECEQMGLHAGRPP